ncbi:hypothetical protein GCM10027578_40060 [Spirosoma luteolum]
MNSPDWSTLNPNQLFAQIIHDSQTGIVIFSAERDAQQAFVDFRFSFINPIGAKMIGSTPEALAGRSYLSFFSEAESSGLLALYRQVLESGVPARASEIPYFADGVSGWFDLYVSAYADSLVVSFTDISSLKQTQLESARQATFFDQLLQTSPNGVIAYEAVRDAGGRIRDFNAVFFNAAYERIFNETATRIRARTFRHRFHSDEDSELFTFYVDTVQTGQSFKRERYYPGLGKWLSLSGEKLFDGFLVIISDITTQKKIELAQQQLTLALQAANQDLLRSNENLQQFAYVASHDLQEPLRKVQQFGDLLKMQYAPVLGDGVDYLNRMQQAAGRMSTLIKDLLSFSRITTQPARTPVDLSALVADVVTDLEMRIQETGATLKVGVLPTLTGDRSQLSQLFQNLLSNALKFKREGIAPDIRLEATTVAADALPAEVQPAWPANRYHQFTFSDNGIGFEMKYADRIFEVFQRLHGKQAFAGTGIGLAICRKVVQNHGGAIVVTSQLNSGTTFHIYLPANGEQAGDADRSIQ